MSDTGGGSRLLTHEDLNDLEAMREKILESGQHLRSDPLLFHLVEVELPRLIATARRGVDPAGGM